jgi:membrane-bound metal-dependent hydrolase YbcI (DUF457 family)
MDWKAHMLVGCIFGAVGGSSILNLPLPALALFAAISGICALLPDLDLRKSKFSQLLYLAAAVAILAAAAALSGKSGGIQPDLFAAYAVALAVVAMALDLLIRPRHRGVMHGLFFLCAISVAAYAALGVFFALALFLGYLSHLLADMCIKA